MEKKTKLIAGLMIALLAVGALGILPVALAQEENPETPQDPKLPNWRARLLRQRHPLLRYVLKNGEYSQVSGEVVTVKGPILVLNTDDGITFVNTPRLWLVGDEIINRTDLFDGEPFGPGSSIEVDTLRIGTHSETHTVTAYFAYQISGDEVEATALLPFNIGNIS